jgi:hypothetical protein
MLRCGATVSVMKTAAPLFSFHFSGLHNICTCNTVFHDTHCLLAVFRCHTPAQFRADCLYLAGLAEHTISKYYVREILVEV